MRTSFRIAVVTLCGLAFLAGTMIGQEKKPELTLAQREKIEALQKKSLQVYIQMNQIQQKYENALRSDPQYAAELQQSTGLSHELNDAVVEAQKGIDPTKWKLNLDSMEFDAVPPPPKPVEKSKAAEEPKK